MRTGRPKVALILTDDERRRLESLAHRSRSAPPCAPRGSSWRVPRAADSKVVARRLHVTPATVCKWRGRFVRRLDGLYDEPRPGAQRTITDEQVEHVIIRTLETTPRGATHWSTRDMAKAVGPESHGHQSDLARLRAAAASDRDVQAVERSAARREGPRHRGAVSESARACGGVLRRREAADSGARSHATAAADAAGPSGAPHARLQTARHHDVVRRAQREDQRGDHAVSSAPSLGAVP